jgi:hypothetical protein
MVGLSKIDNIIDASTPVSTATLTALVKTENMFSVQLPLKRANNFSLAGDPVTGISTDSTAEVTLNTLRLNGNLYVSGWYAAKLYVSLSVLAAAGTAGTITLTS